MRFQLSTNSIVSWLLLAICAAIASSISAAQQQYSYFYAIPAVAACLMLSSQRHQAQPNPLLRYAFAISCLCAVVALFYVVVQVLG